MSGDPNERGDAPHDSTAAGAAQAVKPVGLNDGRVRAVVERITPAVDAGRFPIKRVVGDNVEVEADCFADGHDVVNAVLLWRRAGAAKWHNTPLRPLGNDRWAGAFVVSSVGRWHYSVCAWVDPFLSWRHDFRAAKTWPICAWPRSAVRP